MEEHFKYDYLRNDPECRSIDEILEEKARQQKPTVTRAEVISLAADIHFEVQKGEYCSLDVDSAIWEFLQKKGVVEK